MPGDPSQAALWRLKCPKRGFLHQYMTIEIVAVPALAWKLFFFESMLMTEQMVVYARVSDGRFLVPA
jgi:hypothetical protein